MSTDTKEKEEERKPEPGEVTPEGIGVLAGVATRAKTKNPPANPPHPSRADEVVKNDGEVK